MSDTTRLADPLWARLSLPLSKAHRGHQTYLSSDLQRVSLYPLSDELACQCNGFDLRLSGFRMKSAFAMR